MTSKLINNMKFKATSYKKSLEIPDAIKALWEQSIRSQLLLQLNILLETKHPLNGGFTLIHNARTNTIEIKDSVFRNESRVEYKLVKVAFHADLYNIDRTINKPYFEILVKMLLNNMSKIS